MKNINILLILLCLVVTTIAHAEDSKSLSESLNGKVDNSAVDDAVGGVLPQVSLADEHNVSPDCGMVSGGLGTNLHNSQGYTRRNEAAETGARPASTSTVE